ncbi:hypothetical protein ACFQ1S_00875, partial [Kibdelosporangium lantanae]
GATGRRAIDEDDDWVRREIAEALDHQIRVIPILAGHVDRLTGVPLPANIAHLANCQYLRLRHHDLDADLDHIAEALTDLVRRHQRQNGDSSATNGHIVVNAFGTGNSRIYQAGGNQTINESPRTTE